MRDGNGEEWGVNSPIVSEGAASRGFRKVTGKTPTARTAFGLVAVESVRLGADDEKAPNRYDGPKLYLAMEGWSFADPSRCKAVGAFYRAGDQNDVRHLRR